MASKSTLLASAVLAFAGSAAAFYPIPKYPSNPTAAPRIEWGNFAQDPQRLDLWYRTIRECQSRQETGNDPGSYYQIASVHGSPRDPWDGVFGNNPNFDGFCYHDDPMFATWHRPYVAAFEKSCRECCRQVVNQMRQANPDRNFWGPYAQRCDDLRVPYWDWAKRQGIIPPHFQTSTVDVIRLDGRGRETIPNPMYSYRFQSSRDEIGDGPATFRSDDADNTLWNNQDQLRGAVAALFRSDRVGRISFGDACSYGQQGLNSIENIHGWIHVWCGGYMADISAAGFDPVFMMHHTFIDHLVALWQAVNPNQWFQSYRNPYGSLAQQGGTVETGNTPMRPFRKQDGSWWTPNDCRDHTVMGSTYDSFLRSDGSAKSSGEIYQWIQQTYGDGIGSQNGGWQGGNNNNNKKKRLVPVRPSSGGVVTDPSTAASTDSSDASASTSDADKTNKPDTSSAGADSESAPGGHDSSYKGLRWSPSKNTMYKHKNKLYTEHSPNQYSWNQYHAHYEGSKKHIPCSYTMHAFLGKPTETDPKKYPNDPAYVGSYPVFSKHGGMDMPAKGSIPMTNPIVNYVIAGHLSDSSPKSVEEFCKKNLQWRVEAVDGKDYNKPDVLDKFTYGVLGQQATDDNGKITFGNVDVVTKAITPLFSNLNDLVTPPKIQAQIQQFTSSIARQIFGNLKNAGIPGFNLPGLGGAGPAAAPFPPAIPDFGSTAPTPEG